MNILTIDTCDLKLTLLLWFSSYSQIVSWGVNQFFFFVWEGSLKNHLSFSFIIENVSKRIFWIQAAKFPSNPHQEEKDRGIGSIWFFFWSSQFCLFNIHTIFYLIAVSSPTPFTFLPAQKILQSKILMSWMSIKRQKKQR